MGLWTKTPEKPQLSHFAFIIYSITESGKSHLREWSVVLGNLSHSMKSFVDDVKQLGDTNPESACADNG